MNEAKLTPSTEFKWYVVYVHSGFEHRVVKSLKDRIHRKSGRWRGRPG